VTTTTTTTTTTEKKGFRFSLYGFSIVVLLIALGVSGYLSYLKLFPDVTVVCIEDSIFDCGTVLNSSYSEMWGIPIAWLGFVTNLIMLSILLLERRVSLFAEHGPILVFGVALFAFIYSVYLVYVQGAIIGAYCPWCLTHEALITLVFGASIFRLRAALRE
jgi:uncharacterized membrane protein